MNIESRPRSDVWLNLSWPLSLDLVMPQPLSRIVSNASILMCNAGIRPLSHNPKLGLLAMEAIISWYNVENFMLRMYVELLGGSTEAAAIAYLAVEVQSAKIAMINAIAKDRLEDRYYNLLVAILAVAKTSQKSRDKLAHWIWGFSPAVPDGLLLANPKDNVTELSNDKINVGRTGRKR